MAKKSKPKTVHCRYPKCSFLHESTELLKEDAVVGGSKNSYYHPDCYHTMQTVNQIRDLFIKEINPILTGPQIGQLVSIINNIVFAKKIDVDYLKFALEYFIKNKPGALKHAGGLHYIIQDNKVKESWEFEQDRKKREKIRGMQSAAKVDDEFSLELPKNSFVYKPQKAIGFEDILK